MAVSGEAQPYLDLPNFQPEKGAILANATPVGMHPNKDRIPVAEVPPYFHSNMTTFELEIVNKTLYFVQVTLGDYELVFDAVYTPRKTTLLKEAEAAGAIIVSGVEMFLRQAIGQFNLFTGGEGTSSLFLSFSFLGFLWLHFYQDLKRFVDGKNI